MPSAERSGEQRASPPQIPTLIPEQQQKLDAAHAHHKEREQVERRSATRGLILFALLVLVGSILRAGLGRVFFQGWWRP
ncbi:MAG: hypothetical protein WBY53_12445 [Acidobacteriaceae bacterium]